jgi:hypothetical protein
MLHRQWNTHDADHDKQSLFHGINSSKRCCHELDQFQEILTSSKDQKDQIFVKDLNPTVIIILCLEPRPTMDMSMNTPEKDR